jgi:hypothetical protein
MEAIAELQHEYFRLRFFYGNGEACVDWATERLGRDEENGDLDIISLAGARGRDEVVQLVEVILDRYLGHDRLDDQYLAGKHLVLMHADYLLGRVTIDSIDAILSAYGSGLGYPDWLVMLSRNCEYATDIPDFKQPFEQEFAYIATLWAEAPSKAEFDAKYSRSTSNLHDWPK